MTKPYLNCEYIKDILPAYMGRLLGASEQSLIQSHIDSCEECKSALNILQKLSEKIDSYDSSLLSDQQDFLVDVDSIINKLDSQEIFSSEEISAIVDSEFEEVSYLNVIDNLRNNENHRAELLDAYMLKDIIGMNKLDIMADLKLDQANKNSNLCQFVNDNLSAYVDSELSKGESKQIAVHLLQCSVCRKEFESLKKLLFAVRKVLLEPARNINYWPIIEKKLQKTTPIPMYAVSTVASFAMVVIAWNFLNYNFPLPNAPRNVAASQFATKSTVNSTNKTIADNSITSDQYLFSNVYDTPPSGVIPIMYDYNGLNKDVNKKYDYLSL